MECPSGGLARTAAGLHGCKVGVLKKGAGIGQRKNQGIPGLRVHLVDRFDDPSDIINCRHGLGTFPLRCFAVRSTYFYPLFSVHDSQNLCSPA